MHRYDFRETSGQTSYFRGTKCYQKISPNKGVFQDTAGSLEKAKKSKVLGGIV